MPSMNKLSTYRTMWTEDGDTGCVTYVRTNIVKWDAEYITLNSGGWQTVTTKRKMCQAANQFGLGFYVFQRKGEWFVHTRDGDFEFRDGMRIHRGSGRAYESKAA